MKVLIADDDIMIRYALAAVLAERGHETAEAKDGGEVIECLAAHPPQVVVLDLMMPKVTGFDVLRWMRDNDPEVRTLVIILSAFSAESGGFGDYPHVIDVLEKPVILDRFFDALDRCHRAASLAA
ncbi:MAG: response regulator [Armatimonadetes bacterium]|nr:response regulator [Armatimonadota bacterium]